MIGRISIIVPGVPVAKARPRFTRAGHTYTPTKTRRYEKLIQGYAMACERLSGPLAVQIMVYLPIGASWSRAKRKDALSGQLRPATRPDVDNYAKIALDALNGICFHDDAQVVDLSVGKWYDETPRMEIRIAEAIKR